jgi:hypothetical protein
VLPAAFACLRSQSPGMSRGIRSILPVLALGVLSAQAYWDPIPIDADFAMLVKNNRPTSYSTANGFAPAYVFSHVTVYELQEHLVPLVAGVRKLSQCVPDLWPAPPDGTTICQILPLVAAMTHYPGPLQLLAQDARLQVLMASTVSLQWVVPESSLPSPLPPAFAYCLSGKCTGNLHCLIGGVQYTNQSTTNLTFGKFP